MKYDWLLFDLDNTILNFDDAMVFGFDKTINDFDIPFDENYFSIYQKINHECWADLEKGIIIQDELRILRMERFLNHIDIDKNPIDFAETYHKNLSAKIFWMEDAKGLIEDWSGQYNMALVTNGMREIQRARLVKSDLEKHFRHVIISDEIGVSKPNIRFFDHVFEKIKFPKKDKVIIIGDSLSSDIRGGNDYGIDTCWLNMSERIAPKDNMPTFTIGKLKELKEIVL
jgi:2-haloacid dehalogenase